MKVMVTGGTGFVGSHTVAELIRNGHGVRLLVRSMERVEPTLHPLGVQGVDAIQGDVLDQKSVELAAEGCDATIHCGSVYSLDPRAAGIIRRTNVAGTEIVLDVAHRLGHDPIVHVSSYVALAGMKEAILTTDSPPIKNSGVYLMSKAESDMVARRFQENGAPVVISYPASAWGPNDPHLGESFQMASNILKGAWKINVKGVIPISDVRDIAKLHTALMEKGRGPRRYMAPSLNVTIKEAMATISTITGRKLDSHSLPGWAVCWPMRAFDFLQKILPFKLPFNFQATYVTSLNHHVDDSATKNDFGIEPRPLAETLTDMIRWMAQQGYITPSLAGNLSIK